MRRRKSRAEGQERGRRSVGATGDTQPGTGAPEQRFCRGISAPEDLRLAPRAGARCPRAEGRTPGPRGSRGQTDRRPAAERGEPPSARGGEVGVKAGAAREGWPDARGLDGM